MKKTLKAPFPYFGGKSRVASLIWERFGDAPYYVEPFFGSGAVLLSRPHEPKVETINDMDAWVVNFWRAVQHDPQAVAKHADWPVSELDLHARGDWLFYRPDAEAWAERIRSDPDFYDAKSAGWWVWGARVCIGRGWLRFSKCHRVDRSIPKLSKGAFKSYGGFPDAMSCILALSHRLRNVRVCCGDWSRVCKPSVLNEWIGTAAVFLDPPYGVKVRDRRFYGDHYDLSLAAGVRAWCLENGRNPRIRIALCGYAGEGHESLEEAGWSCTERMGPPGFGVARKNGVNDNRHRERIWFSPHCLGAVGTLF